MFSENDLRVVYDALAQFDLPATNLPATQGSVAMAAIDVLLPEILAYIMALASGRRIQYKMRLVAVCQHWRQVGLSSPLLWASINAASARALQSLTLALSRSQAAPLDLTLLLRDIDGPDASSQAQRDAAVRAVVPHSGRLERLVIEFNHQGATSELLDKGLSLHALRWLTLRCEEYTERHLVTPTPTMAPLCIDIPHIEQLSVKHAAPRSWDSLLSSQLTSLTIIDCAGVDSALHATIFGTCTRLESFKLAARYVLHGITPCLEIQAPESGCEAPSLRALDLEALHYKDFRNVLAGLSGHYLPSITLTLVTSSYIVMENLMLFRTILDAFIDGFGDITSMELLGEKTIRLVDDKGAVRHLVAEQTYMFKFQSYWDFLVKHRNAGETLRKLRVHSHLIGVASAAFDALPISPFMQIALRIVITRHPAFDPPAARNARLSIPRIWKVILISDMGGLQPEGVLTVLRRVRTDAKTVPVCVRHLNFRGEAAHLVLRVLQVLIAQERTSGSQWSICSCARCAI